MIPRHDGRRDDLDTQPGEHYKKSKAHREKIGNMNSDEEIDRNYIRGLQAGWIKGTNAGNIEGKLMYKTMSDKQMEYWENELKKIYDDYALCLNNRLNGIREAHNERD